MELLIQTSPQHNLVRTTACLSFACKTIHLESFVSHLEPNLVIFAFHLKGAFFKKNFFCYSENMFKLALFKHFRTLNFGTLH